MDKKKILIVCRAFYPGNWPRAFRPTELAKEYARQGHVVTVITPKVEVHAEFEKKYGIAIKDLGRTKWKGFELKGNKFLVLVKKIINRLLSWLLEYPNIELMYVVAKALRSEKDYDLLISIAKPYMIHWGVAKAISRDRNLTRYWVADCGDPYLKSADSDINPPFYFHWVDSWFLRKVDFVAIPIKEALSAYNQKYIDKFRIIPQGFRFEDIKLYEGPLNKENVIFGYAGMFIPGKRDPSELLEFLNSLDSTYKFEFNIYTHSPWLIEPYSKISNGRIKLHPVMSREDVLYELSKMHFVVNFENSGTTQSPSKLIDYGILKKPVLSVKYKELDKANVLQFLKGDYNKQMSLGDIEKCRIENVSSAFLDLIG